MLEMFGLQRKSLGLTDLKVFLNKKTLQQQLVLENGCYSLCK